MQPQILNPKVTVLIQARLSSRRLPSKVLLPLGGVPMIQWIYERASKISSAHEVVVVTSTDPSDDEMANFLEQKKINYFRGPLDDVLARYYLAAVKHQSNVVVRLTGDCPLLDPLLVDRMIQEFLAGPEDFLTNCYEASYPDGLDASIFTMDILAQAYHQADLKSEREHVVPWMWKMSTLGGGDKYLSRNIKCPQDLSQHRWTVDEPVDYQFIKDILAAFENRALPLQYAEILKVIETSKIERINAQITRDEGLARSLANDCKIDLSHK